MFGNNVDFLGRITHDLELRQLPSGVAVLDFNLARNRMKPKDGGDPETDFVRCTAFGKTAETINTYFSKGDRIGIGGRLQVDNYETSLFYYSYMFPFNFSFLMKKYSALYGALLPKSL